MTLKSLLTSVAALSVFAGSALAGETQKFYASLQYGFDAPAEETLRGANAGGAPRNIDIEYKDGVVLAAAFGVVAHQGDYGRLRLEVETAYRESDVDSLVLNDVSRRFRGDSHQSTTTAMINALYDTPLLADRVRLFGGAGFGIAVQDHEVRYLVERPDSAGGNLPIALPTSETTWAAQAIVGGEVILTNHLSAVADVRFVDFGDTQVQRFILSNGNLDSILDAENSTFSGTVGLRFNF